MPDKRPHVVFFRLDEIPKKDKSRETESKVMAATARKKREYGVPLNWYVVSIQEHGKILEIESEET